METAIVFGILALTILITDIILEEFVSKPDKEYLMGYRALKLAPVGVYLSPSGILARLNDYAVDIEGNLYSKNGGSWEINHLKGRDLLRCSDDSFTSSGMLVNSLRSTNGRKVTIPRHKLKYDKLSTLNGVISIKVKATTDRHFKIIS